MMDNKGTIEIYKTLDGSFDIDVKMQDETVWLNQEQMSKLFNKGKPTLSEHISNIFAEKELVRKATIRKYRIVQQEGNRQVTREIEYYNLDVIISIGYRVKSKQGTQFRIWATSTLKEYIKKGYALNQKRLEQSGKDVTALIEMLDQAVTKESLATPEAAEMIKIIKSYSQSFRVLQQYDEDSLAAPQGSKPTIQLDINESRNAVASLKEDLIKKGEATDLFAKERSESFAAILGNIEQTFDGKPLYPTLESKAAHLLYFIIKDHPFLDGNKRSAAFMFIRYLALNNSLIKNGVPSINESGLVAMTLLIAESNPTNKELMINLVQNLIT